MAKPRPSAFRAHVEVSGVGRTMDEIKLIGARGKNTRPLMVRAVNYLALTQERRVHRKPWTPLAGSTVERKTTENENPEILRDESRFIKGRPTRVPDFMYEALTQAGHPGQVRGVTRASAKFGLNSSGRNVLFYARFVQNVKGTKRRILAISQSDALFLTKMVGNYVYEGK